MRSDDTGGVGSSIYAQFAGSTAITGDFIDVAEDVSGLDLGDLFESWLFEGDVPEFP